jgi:hypothetical protein
MADHLIAAKQIESRKPKVVIIHRIRLKAFLNDGGPISRVIQKDYAPGGGSPSVAMFIRKGGA